MKSNFRFLILAMFITFGFKSSGALFYVKNNAVGLNNGSSWTNAFTSLQSALAVATSGDSIWVAKGTYKPTTTTNRAIYFEIPTNVKVFGAFTGNESTIYDLNLRDFVANETILSGDIGIPGDSLDNSFHLIYTENIGVGLEVNGFTIENGFANGAGDRNSGGAWLNKSTLSGLTSGPLIKNCKIRNNWASLGAGICNIAQTSGLAPFEINNCLFENNFANDNSSGGRGGAIYNVTISGGSINSIITNSYFIKNKALTGGVLTNYLFGGNIFLEISNCVFFSNTDIDGSAIIANLNLSNSASNVKFYNCSASGNVSNDVLMESFVGFGYSGSNSWQFINTIFFGNTGVLLRNSTSSSTSFQNCLLDLPACPNQNNTSCNEGMIYNQNPNFIDQSNGNLNLRCDSSPVINTGVNSVGVPTTDILGKIRFNNSDIGAFEYYSSDVNINQKINSNINSKYFGKEIFATNIIDNSNNILYEAIESINLNAGFKISPEIGSPSVFETKIKTDCP